MNYEKACGAVVFTKINNEIKYVIIQQIEGFHGFPKGHVEGEETEEQTALREIYEEIGVKVKLIEEFKNVVEYPLPKKKDTMKQVVYFVAEYEGQELKIQEEELLSVQILSYDEAMEILEYENSKEILKKANDFLKNYINK